MAKRHRLREQWKKAKPAYIPIHTQKDMYRKQIIEAIKKANKNAAAVST